MPARRSVYRARRQQGRNLVGYVVAWDVDSSDLAQCARLGRYIFGQTVTMSGKAYRYPGYVELEGVRYLGQSVLFVERSLLEALRKFLRSNDVDHVVSEATLGPILPN